MTDLPRPPRTSRALWKTDYEAARAARRAYRQWFLDAAFQEFEGQDPHGDDLDDYFKVLGVRSDKKRRRLVKQYGLDHGRRRGAPPRPLRRTNVIELAPPGRPYSDPRFKSPWEDRLAAALNRLEMRWRYEPVRLEYVLGGQLYDYIPDFALLEHPRTYVEVKGPSGVGSVDALKMDAVVRQYPNVVLLLWTPLHIELIEDAENVGQVESLLTRTRLAA